MTNKFVEDNLIRIGADPTPSIERTGEPENLSELFKKYGLDKDQRGADIEPTD